MDTRFDVNSTVDTLVGLKNERRGFDTFGRSIETDNSVQAAREKLGIPRSVEQTPDNRALARQTLFSGRKEMTPQEDVDYGYDNLDNQSSVQASRLYIDSSFDSSFETRSNGYHINDIELMPSSTTMKYADYARAQDVVQNSAAVATIAHKPMTKKQKLTIAIYSGIAVVVGALIITTGALIGALSADVNKLKANVSLNQSQYELSLDKLNQVKSDESIREAANGLGMVDGGTSVRFTPLATAEPDSYSAPTNSFDKFCDWLSHVFG